MRFDKYVLLNTFNKSNYLLSQVKVVDRPFWNISYFNTGDVFSMACMSSLGFSYLVTKINILKYPIIVRCLFIHTIIISIMLSGCYSDKLNRIPSFNVS